MEETINYMKDFPTPNSLRIRIKKTFWELTWVFLISWTPKSIILDVWRRFLYRSFGAEIPSTSNVHASAHIYMPWNLKMGPWSVIGSGAHVLNADMFYMGQNCVVSERAYICCASHNIQSNAHEQTHAPITMGDRSWVAAEAFVMMGVTIGEGAVVGARAAVFKDVEPWTVVGGNPAKFIKKREIEG